MYSGTSKIKLYDIGIFLSILLFASCASGVYKSVWQPSPINEKDSAQTFINPFRLYDYDNKLYYSINNDLKNIYLCFKTDDKETQLHILNYGLEIWMDSTGRHREITGLTIPFSLRLDSLKKHSIAIGKSESQDLNHAKLKFVRAEKNIHLTGFRSPIGGKVPFKNDYGIMVSLNWDSTNTAIMVIRAIIPFNTFYKLKLNGGDSIKPFGLSFKTKTFVQDNGFGRSGYGMYPAMGMGGMGMGGSGLSIGMGSGLGMGGLGMGGMSMGMGVRLPVGGGGPNAGNRGSIATTVHKTTVKFTVKKERVIR